MYNYLINKGFSPAQTAIATAFWFALLALAVLYCAFEPQAELKYLTL
ncbi:MAG: hypothetical protein ABL951_04835 [Alphaproteobacteria bacterium]